MTAVAVACLAFQESGSDRCQLLKFIAYLMHLSIETPTPPPLRGGMGH